MCTNISFIKMIEGVNPIAGRREHWYGKLNGWLLIPNAAPKEFPFVLVIPGWTGFKEEMYSAYATQLIY